jgi:myosin heavy subunit
MSWFVPETGTEDKVYIRDAQYAWLPATVVPTFSDDDGESNSNNNKEDDTNKKQDNTRVQVRIELPSDWKSTTVLCHSSNQNDKQTTSETATHEQTLRWVSLKDYPKHQLLLQNQGVLARDMAELPHLHEAAILYQVKERHVRQKPYTRVGEIVVAINPCQWIEGLYTKEQQEKYAQILVWQEQGTCCMLVLHRVGV